MSEKAANTGPGIQVRGEKKVWYRMVTQRWTRTKNNAHSMRDDMLRLDIAERMEGGATIMRERAVGVASIMMVNRLQYRFLASIWHWRMLNQA